MLEEGLINWLSTLKVKCKGLSTCYIAAFMRDEKTCKQQRFTILEVTAGWHELVVLRCIM